MKRVLIYHNVGELMKKSISSNRLIYFDLMRIVACFCVIVIHVGVYNQTDSFGNRDLQLLSMNFYGIISRWAVPCFVMLSGIMFLNRNKDIPLRKLYFKYISRMIISYVFWSFVYCLYNMIYSTDCSLSEMVHYIINNWLSGEIHMWYVLMTIGLYIITPILKIIKDNISEKMLIYWLCIMFVFFSVVPFLSDLGIPFISTYISYINVYMELNFLLGYTFYYILGYSIFNNRISDKSKTLIYILGIAGFIYSFMILIVLKYFVNINMGASNYCYPNIVFMSVAVLLLFIDKVSKISFKTKTKKIIVSISNLTYGIFLIHVLILKILYHLGIDLSLCNMVISVPLVALITFIISMIIILGISKIPKINKYIC